MDFWILLWKLVFIVGMIAFGILAIWVTIFGARDIVHLLATLKASGDTKD